MQQATAQAMSGKRRRRYANCLASVILAAGLVLSTSVNAFAAAGFNGGGVKPSIHLDRPVHYTNGDRPPREEQPGDAPWDNLTSSSYFGTIHVQVGETVTIHLQQRGVGLFGPENISLPQWYGYNGRDYQATVGIKTNVDGLQKSEMFPHLKVYKPQNRPDDTTNTAYCMELSLTGKKPGAEYFYYEDGSYALEGAYYKVVVTGAGADRAAQPSSGGGQSSSGGNKASFGSAADGSAKDHPNHPTTASEHVQVPSSSIYTVKAGDTPASIALNAYGDMGVWPQLQEANRQYLAETKDGMIFAGFNLYLPEDLAGGRIPEATAAVGEKLYTVTIGDTYRSIAQMHFGDAGRYREIFNRNSDRLKDIDTLFAGQIIVLP